MNQDTLGRATYSPEDNKLRLYPDARLSTEDYQRARNAGFKWAPAQELFVAPMWTPEREDLLVEWCGEVGDEDSSLVERAEQRAERFEDYSANRAEDAEQAHKAVSAIADNIPLGQPILVGHHSERHARKDAERIESGMRKAVKMWETSQYWAQRAKGAIRAAKYKEQPAVRARRIKRLEADKRKQERFKAGYEHCLRFWLGELNLVNKATGEKRPLEISEANREKIYHILGSSSDLGYLPVCKHPELDQYWHAWDVLRPDGERWQGCPSMTIAEIQAKALEHYPALIAHCERWISHYNNRLAYEKAMLEDQGGIASDKTQPEKGGGCRCWASPRGGWSLIQKVNKVSVTILDNWGNGGGNFTRTIPFDKCCQFMTAEQVKSARDCGRLIETPDKTGFYLADKPVEGTINAPEPYKAPEPTKFDALKDALKAGVQVVSAPQLFPTPKHVAEQMADLADLTAGDKVLEPSAGTGNLIRSAVERGIFLDDCTAVEINPKLAGQLEAIAGKVVCGDFLDCNGDLGKFDCVLMNPPFQNGSDVKHIKHALNFLEDGGRLVAICANGSRQQAELQSMADTWEELPEGTFREQGTNVRTVLLTIIKS